MILTAMGIHVAIKLPFQGISDLFRFLSTNDLHSLGLETYSHGLLPPGVLSIITTTEILLSSCACSFEVLCLLLGLNLSLYSAFILGLFDPIVFRRYSPDFSWPLYDFLIFMYTGLPSSFCSCYLILKVLASL